MELITHSPGESMRLGEIFARHLEPGTLVAYYGEMGAGKTTFTKGVARGLGIDDCIHSPTFNLIHEHTGGKRLCHADLYRLEGQEEIDGTGLEEYIRSDAVTAVEWSERFETLPKRHVIVRFEILGDEARRISFASDYLPESLFDAVKEEYLS
ncbi:MAG: tRNA (adenosine(37)-N6)-threonylcarbamoyltransferase complex ATPase subunit type 1 TsaE [Abditibacteriota bacterium]|nr:tRNA (adenosine(37)-N6)-threonylcarbamoyltransferase complex ATPase subunit type 1 TsaE [Abditibacteriota bacterium]